MGRLTKGLLALLLAVFILVWCGQYADAIKRNAPGQNKNVIQPDPNPEPITSGGEEEVKPILPIIMNPATGYSAQMNKLPVLVEDTLSGPNLPAWLSWDTAEQSYSHTFVADPATGDRNVLRLEVRYGDPDATVGGSKRAEVFMVNRTNELVHQFEEHWYSIEVYFPATGEDAWGVDNQPESIWQFHDAPDRFAPVDSYNYDINHEHGTVIGGVTYYGHDENWKTSSLAMLIDDGAYQGFINADDEVYSTMQSVVDKGYRIEPRFPPVETGRWVKWDIHYKTGWLPSHGPILEIYKDGELLYERIGLMNTWNDYYAPYVKFGIYKWVWASGATNVSKRVAYYKNLVIR